MNNRLMTACVLAAAFTGAALASQGADIPHAPASAPATRPATAAAVDSKVIAILAKQLELKAAEIKPTYTFKDLGMDELDLVEAIMQLEDQWQITIPDELLMPDKNDKDAKDVLKMTVGDLCGIVNKCIASAETRPAKSPKKKTLPK